MTRQRILSLLLAVGLVFSLSSALSPGSAAAATIVPQNSIVFNPALLQKVGTNNIYGPCACYAMAYCKTILDRKPHKWYEYNRYGNSTKNFDCIWGSGYARTNTKNKKTVFQQMYHSINAGRPCIVYVTHSNGGQHWVAVVGYQNVKNLNTLSEKNFLMLDSGNAKTLTAPASLYKLRTNSKGEYMYVPTKTGMASTTAKTEIPTPPAGNVAVAKGTYLLVNKASGKALQAAGTKNKSDLYINTKSSAKEQQFVVNKSPAGWYNISPAGNTKLAVNSFSYTPKYNVKANLYTLDQYDNTQGWYFVKTGSYLLIRNAYNHNLVLTPSGTSNKSGLKIATYAKNNQAQLWSLTAVTSPPIDNKPGTDDKPVTPPESTDPFAGGTYMLANKASGRFLDVYGQDNTSSSLSKMQIYDKIGSGGCKSQKFTIERNSKGWYSIIPTSNTKLAVNQYSYTPKAGTKVNVYPLDRTDNTQGWYVKAAGNGYYLIRSAYNQDLALTAAGKANKSLVNLGKYTANNQYQLWKPVKVS